MACTDGRVKPPSRLWAPMVVFVDERIELVLELLKGFGVGLGGEPFLECLFEPFHFPTGGWVGNVSGRFSGLGGFFRTGCVLLRHQRIWRCSRGVVGQHRCWEPGCFSGFVGR